MQKKDGELARLATRQLSLVTTATAVTAGLSYDDIGYRTSMGRLATVRRGVRRVAGSAATWEQAVLAACLVAGDPVAGSHLTAAFLLAFLRVHRPEAIE